MKKHNTVMRAFAAVSQFGINMIVPIAMCSALGYFLDEWLATGFLMILLFFIGAIAGFRNIYIFARQIYENDERENEYVSRSDRQK